MAKLSGEHHNLAAVVGIVSDKVTDKTSNIRAETLDPSIAINGAADKSPSGRAGCFPRPHRLRRSNPFAIQLRRNIFCLCGL